MTLDPTLQTAIRDVAQAWRPIETAPSSGERVLLFCPGRGAIVGRWLDDEKRMADRATHWMPLPPPPAAEWARGQRDETGGA